MKQRAIFLGSFDPPHLGHYNCLNSVVDCIKNNQLSVDIEKIHVIPALQNPNKKNSLPFWTRYKMCKLMFKSLCDYVIVDDIERLVKPQYTYQLINYFKEADDILDKNFWWIITNETFNELWEGKWKESEYLLNTNKFIVLEESKDKKDWPHYYDIPVIQVPLIEYYDIHSTDIRNNVENNKDKINQDVYNFIKENHLYNI